MVLTTKRELSELERRRSYSKYYDIPMTPPPPDIYETLDGGPVDCIQSLSVHRREDLLRPGYLPVERGYCIMPDGTGFVAGLTTMPGVTAEMIDWWFAWHGLEGLRYAIWNVDQHYDVYVMAKDLERRLNPNLSDRERNWNTTDVVTEDVGTGTLLLDISFMSPENFGFDPEAFRKGALTAVNANLGLHEADSPLVCFTHIARAIPGGIELRSRFWIGWNIRNRKPLRVGQNVPAEVIAGLTKALAYHCPKEYYNLKEILPTVYADNAGIVDRLEDFRS